MRGHVHKRVTNTKNGKVTTNWYVVIDIGRRDDGPRRQKWHGAYRTRKEAEAAKSKLISDYNNGTYVEPHPLTLREFTVEQWLPSIRTQLKASTYDSYRKNFELHILPALGHLQLQQISPKLLNDFYAEKLVAGNKRNPGGLNPKTVRYLHTTLHKAFADAIDLGLVATNPVTRAKPPRVRGVSSVEMKFWDANQVRAFLEFSRSARLYAVWHLGVMTGMRRGEIAGLRWKDIDFERHTISIRHTIVSVGYQLTESTPKSHKARVIDIDEGTCDVLRQRRAAQQNEVDDWADDYQDNDYVFSREDGSPIHPDTLSQAFERLVKRSGLPRIRFHDLRHTHATVALQAGVPVKVISERLGHESPAFTLKQYAHVIPGMQAEAARMVADLIAGASGP